MVAYAGTLGVGSNAFTGDASPGVLTTSGLAILAPNITKLELIPDPLDYVAYENFSFKYIP